MNVTDEEQISKAAAVMGKKGGKVKSAAKTKAVRENGKKGGRPRKPCNNRNCGRSLGEKSE